MNSNLTLFLFIFASIFCVAQSNCFTPDSTIQIKTKNEVKLITYKGSLLNGYPEGKGQLFSTKNEIVSEGEFIASQYTYINSILPSDYKDGYSSFNKNIKIDAIGKKSFKAIFLNKYKFGLDNLQFCFVRQTEDSRYFYFKFFNDKYIIDSQTNKIAFIRIDSLEKQYSLAYQIRQKEKVIRYGHLPILFSRDYFNDGEQTIRTDHSSGIGLLRTFNYKNCKIADFPISDGIQYNTAKTNETNSNEKVIEGIGNLFDNGNIEEFVGGLFKASLIDGVNSADERAKALLGKPAGVKVNPIYNYLVTGFYANKQIYVWGFDKKTLVVNSSMPAFTLKGHNYQPNRMMFDPTGNYLISSADALVPLAPITSVVFETIIWDMSKKKIILHLEDFVAHDISPDGNYLMTSRSVANSDKASTYGGNLKALNTQIKVIEISTGKIVFTYDFPINPEYKSVRANIVMADFSPDNNSINILIDHSDGMFKFTAHYEFISLNIDENYLREIKPKTKILSKEYVKKVSGLNLSDPILNILQKNQDNFIRVFDTGSSKFKPKDEFETTFDYEKRLSKMLELNIAKIQKLWEQNTGFYVDSNNQTNIFTVKPTELKNYDADITKYYMYINGYLARFKIPLFEAKALKDKGLADFIVSGEKVAIPQSAIYDYKKLILKNVETGKSFPGEFINSFIKFITN